MYFAINDTKFTVGFLPTISTIAGINTNEVIYNVTSLYMISHPENTYLVYIIMIRFARAYSPRWINDFCSKDLDVVSAI
jgi:hypothetical protein